MGSADQSGSPGQLSRRRPLPSVFSGLFCLLLRLRERRGLRQQGSLVGLLLEHRTSQPGVDRSATLSRIEAGSSSAHRTTHP